MKRWCVSGMVVALALAAGAEEFIEVSTGQHYYDVPSLGRPFGTDPQRFQILVLESELAANAGDRIVGMAFNCVLASTKPAVFSNVRILLCPTSKPKLDTGFDANYDGHEPEVVLAQDLLQIDWVREEPPAPAPGSPHAQARRLLEGGGEWRRIAFETPFEYPGSGNLIVEIRHDGGTGTLQTTRWQSDEGRVIDSVGAISRGPNAATGYHRGYLNGLRIYLQRSADHDQ